MADLRIRLSNIISNKGLLRFEFCDFALAHPKVGALSQPSFRGPTFSVSLENIQLLEKKLDNGPKPLPPLTRTHSNTFTRTSYHIQKERKINLKWIIDLLVKNTPNYETAMKKKVGETLGDLGLEKDFLK